MAVVVFPTPPDGPIKAPERWLGGYGAGGCGKSNVTSLGRLSICLIKWTILRKLVAHAICHFALQATFTSHNTEASNVDPGLEHAPCEVLGRRAASAVRVPKSAGSRPAHVNFASQQRGKVLFGLQSWLVDHVLPLKSRDALSST